MVVDTSAVVAILTNEAGSERYVEALDDAQSVQISVATVLEIAIVVEARYGEAAREDFDHWLATAPVEVVVLTREQVEAAKDGFRRFGKCRHPAGLNFGDCFSYGLAKVSGEPILYRGRDFSKTDLRSVLPHL